MSEKNRVKAGAPTGGQFAEHYRPEAKDGVLGHFIADVPAELTFEHDGGDLTITEWDENVYTASGDPYSVNFPVDVDAPSEELLRQLGTNAYDEERLRIAKLRLGQVPILDAQLTGEIKRLEKLVKRHDGMLAPADWEGDYTLTRASDFVDDRLDENQTCARCDYAEVGEEGIAYGYKMYSHFLGEIVAGEQDLANGEGEQSYSDRIVAAIPTEKWQEVESYFSEKWGASVIESGDYADFDLEFFVKYPRGSGGAEGVSLEYMGDRAENKTKLLALRDSYEAGGTLQGDVAKILGYEWKRNNPRSYDQYDGGSWVKVEEDESVSA